MLAIFNLHPSGPLGKWQHLCNNGYLDSVGYSCVKEFPEMNSS